MRDYDNIRWYLLHEKVVIFIENKQWYIGILNRCKQLQPDNRCGIYEIRPAICRSYTTDNCDYHAGDYGYDKLFTSAESLWEYATKVLADERLKKKKKSRKNGKGRGDLATRARIISQSLPIPTEGGRSANGQALALPQLRK